MNEKDLLAIERIQFEIERIEKNENKIYFFVIDSGGSPINSSSF